MAAGTAEVEATLAAGEGHLQPGLIRHCTANNEWPRVSNACMAESNFKQDYER